MTAFIRTIKFLPGYDHRDESHDKGTHGMDIAFTLVAEDGSHGIMARFGTDWQSHPLKRPYGPNQPTPRERWDKPGIDAGWPHHGDFYHGSPNPQMISFHVADGASPLVYGDEGECDLLPGGTCYSDVNFTACDDFVKTLVEGGDEAAWLWLVERYQEWVSSYE